MRRFGLGCLIVMLTGVSFAQAPAQQVTIPGYLDSGEDGSQQKGENKSSPQPQATPQQSSTTDSTNIGPGAASTQPPSGQPSTSPPQQ